MTAKERRFCNELHYAVKGHLISESYSDEEVKAIGDSYMKRLWGNHERLSNCKDDFLKLWAMREEDHEDSLKNVAVLGYD